MTRKWMIIPGVAAALAITAFVFSEHSRRRAVVHEGPADLRISAAQLTQDFLVDESRANGIYLGKIIEVHGTVREVLRQEDTEIVMLAASARAAGVSCYLRPGQQIELRKGQRVSIRGLCNGMLLDVVMDKCVVLPKEH